MSKQATETRSVIVERDLPHPPEKVWRALTQPHLLEDWLMKTDFQPEIGREFRFSAEWGAVQGEVVSSEEGKALSYTWGDGTLDTVVSWTLTPSAAGTLLRMEQTGFRADEPRYLIGATAGWPRFLDNLETVLAQIA